jgi:hypothetical protein
MKANRAEMKANRAETKTKVFPEGANPVRKVSIF